MHQLERVLAFASMLGSASLFAAPAFAHINLLEPAPRTPGRPDTMLLRGPCGQRNNARREEGVSVFRPGQSIDVEWEAYVQHVSYFRIAFDADGDDSFSARPSMPRDPAADDPTTLPAADGEFILDYVLDRTGDIDRVERRVTLPDVACERCTLQLIQFTYGLPIAEATYYQCADLVLDASAPGGDAEAEGTTDGGTALDVDRAAEEGVGCALAARGTGSSRASGGSWLLLAGVFLLALRRPPPRWPRRGQGMGNDSIHCPSSST